MSVLRRILGSDNDHPKPKGPFPEPESYDKESCGPKPERPGLTASGTVIGQLVARAPRAVLVIQCFELR